MTSSGLGDRPGIATPGHIQALESGRVFPILAQQSVRENARTGRSFDDVMADAMFGVFRAGYTEGFGADADHLKEIEDAVEAADKGFTFFTCDPGDHVQPTERMTPTEIAEAFERLPSADAWRSRYLGRTFHVGSDVSLSFGERELQRAGVKYGRAIAHAIAMYRALAERLPDGFDYEVSVDETESPTTPREHLFVALELRHEGVEFASLAPRFVGAMEKGVDWRGDMDRFRADLHTHAEIARAVSGYRLSLHSGSDKFSLYPLLARETAGACHVKTAGTSYLVALQVIASIDPHLFRRIAAFSIEAFAEDKATYHISADPSRIPDLESLGDHELPELIEQHDSRQVLHVAYGSVLGSAYRTPFFELLKEHEEQHDRALAAHLGKHVRLLEGDSHE